MVLERYLDYEREIPFILERHVRFGDVDSFIRIASVKGNIIYKDADGISINTPEKAVDYFNEHILPAGSPLRKPYEIDDWHSLKNWAKAAGLPEEVVEAAENGFYLPDIVGRARPYPFSKQCVKQLARLTQNGGELRVLTARTEEVYGNLTRLWYQRHHRGLVDQIMFSKQKELEVLEATREAKKNDVNVIFIDDTTLNIENVVGAMWQEAVTNFYAIQVPIGRTRAAFVNGFEGNLLTYAKEHLLVIDRYPFETQGQYPFYQVLRMVPTPE